MAANQKKLTHFQADNLGSLAQLLHHISVLKDALKLFSFSIPRKECFLIMFIAGMFNYGFFYHSRAELIFS